MSAFQEILTVETHGRGFVDVTRAVNESVAKSGVAVGVCTVFIQHTSASLVIQENADPAVLRDLQKWMDRIAPESEDYEHDAEGPDDMPGHIRAAITKTSETIPVGDHALRLGTWQALYVWEHRASPHRRRLVVTVLSD